MAWTVPRTWVTDEVVTPAMMNTHVRDNENFLHTAHASRMFQAGALGHGSTSSIYLLITWDTVDYDTDGFSNNTSDWFVVPSGWGGYYRLSGIVSFATNATGWRQIKMVKNETYTGRTPNGVGTSLQIGPSGNGSGTIGVPIGWQGPLLAGDHVTIEGWQSSGTNLSYQIGADSMSVEFAFLGT